MTENVVKIGFWLRAYDSVTVEADADAEAIEKAEIAATTAMTSTAHPEHVEFDERREASSPLSTGSTRTAANLWLRMSRSTMIASIRTARPLAPIRRHSPAASSSPTACRSMSRSRMDWFPASPSSTRRRSPILLSLKATPATSPKRSPPRTMARPGPPGPSAIDDRHGSAPRHPVGRLFLCRPRPRR